MLTLPSNIQLKSPLAAAVVLSLAVTAGAILATLGSSNIGAIIGDRSPAPQEHTAAAIARLEHNVGALTRDVDFVTSRIHASIKRSDDLALDRFSQMDATIAVLNQRIAGLQADHLVSAPAAARPADSLRSSLNEIAAHTGAIAAITKRLDRIEVKVGMSTDTEPRVRHVARRKAPAAQKPAESADLLAQTGAALFGLRPAAKPTKPLRVSTLRD